MMDAQEERQATIEEATAVPPPPPEDPRGPWVRRGFAWVIVHEKGYVIARKNDPGAPTPTQARKERDDPAEALLEALDLPVDASTLPVARIALRANREGLAAHRTLLERARKIGAQKTTYAGEGPCPTCGRAAEGVTFTFNGAAAERILALVFRPELQALDGQGLESVPDDRTEP
jgi:hypothetical protein